MTLSGDCIPLKSGMQIYVVTSNKIKTRIVGIIDNEHKINYDTVDENGSVGAWASCCFVEYHAAVAYFRRELS